MKVSLFNHDRRLTMAEAISSCGLDTEEVLANVLTKLVDKDIINADELAEIFYWDVQVEELKE